jgi:hypothetical protein
MSVLLSTADINDHRINVRIATNGLTLAWLLWERTREYVRRCVI